MIDLTPHEQKILDLVKKNPNVIDNPEKRKFIAEQNGLSEKTLRNRIGDLRKYGVLTSSENPYLPIIAAEFDDDKIISCTTDYITGCCMFMHISIYRRLDGFDDKYFIPETFEKYKSLRKGNILINEFYKKK